MCIFFWQLYCVLFFSMPDMHCWHSSKKNWSSVFIPSQKADLIASLIMMSMLRCTRCRLLKKFLFKSSGTQILSLISKQFLYKEISSNFTWDDVLTISVGSAQLSEILILEIPLTMVLSSPSLSAFLITLSFSSFSIASLMSSHAIVLIPPLFKSFFNSDRNTSVSLRTMTSSRTSSSLCAVVH